MRFAGVKPPGSGVTPEQLKQPPPLQAGATPSAATVTILRAQVNTLLSLGDVLEDDVSDADVPEECERGMMEPSVVTRGWTASSGHTRLRREKR